MTKQVAIVLAGCGVFDGSEIYETTLTLLRLDQLGIGYRCFAPDVAQHHVINHLDQSPVEGETRNVLQESARLARAISARLPSWRQTTSMRSSCRVVLGWLKTSLISPCRATACRYWRASKRR